MAMGGVDIEKTAAASQAELEKDKTVSPTLKNLIGLLILVLQMMVQRLEFKLIKLKSSSFNG